MLRDGYNFPSSDPNPANFGFFKKQETENHNTWEESTFCITTETSFFPRTLPSAPALGRVPQSVF